MDIVEQQMMIPSISSSSPEAELKKKGRRGRKKAQPIKVEEGTGEAVVKPKRGRPKKIKDPNLVVKKEPKKSRVHQTEDSSILASPFSSNQAQSSAHAVPIAKKRRGAGGRKAGKKNSTGGDGNQKNFMDIFDVIPDEELIPEELVGFEHIEIHRAAEAEYYNWGRNLLYETDVNPYAMPMGAHFSGFTFNSNRQSVNLQMGPKVESGINSNFQYYNR
ncbi:uncharacterized protein LOC110843951 [Folsomia candida]|nr:uncharacterized protein LOC110843951 [Folsomia candida]